MTRQEGTKEFGDVNIQQKSAEFLGKLDGYMSVYFDEQVNQFVKCFEQYARKVIRMQQAGGKEPVAFMNFSVLRTNILANKHWLKIDAYDQNWYSDRAECSGEYDVSTVYQWLDKFALSLEAARKKSIGQLKLSDLQRLVFKESNRYLSVVTEVIRSGMKKAAETESYRNMKRQEVFTVCVGYFQDQSYIVHREDTRSKDAKAVKRHLQTKRQKVYTYEICEQLDLSNGDYEAINLLFSSFIGSDFTSSSFKKAIILSSKFGQAALKDSKLEEAQMVDVDFGGAVLENVSFKGAKLKQVSFAGATLIRVQFEDAILLEELNFDNVKLIDTELPTAQKGSR